MKNYYAQAIDILMNNRCCKDQLLTEIAKANPAAIVKGFKAYQASTWVGIVKPIYAAGRKIDAIKECRKLTGMSLKKAKAAVESIKI